MKLRPYPKYKPSGVEWLGEVPENWAVEKFSRTVRIAEGQVDPESEPYASMLLVAPNHIESGTGRMLGSETAAEQAATSGKYLCRRGDVLYSKIRPALAKATLAPEDCICSADMYPMTPSARLESRFLLALLLSGPFTAWSVLEADRVAMPKINRETLNELRLPVPPVEEQRTIVDFLDRGTARIDELVEKKRTLIVRLKEKRMALISRTVTRGLPPAAALEPHHKLKPSGVDWLGDVPEHWQSFKATHGFRRIGSGTTPKSDDSDYYDGDIPWATTSELRETVITDTATKITAAATDAYPTLRVYPPGTLLFAMYGATIGRLGILGIPCTVNQACAAFAEPLVLETKFTYYWLLMRRPTLVVLSAGGGQPNLSQDDLRQLRIPAPPREEQQRIAHFLDGETAKIDLMINRVETAIERLQEYRSALITAAVTGKIDVRGV